MKWAKSLTCATIVSCAVGCSSDSDPPDGKASGGRSATLSGGNGGQGGSANLTGGRNAGGNATLQGGAVASAGHGDESAAAARGGDDPGTGAQAGVGPGAAGATQATAQGGMALSYGGASDRAGNSAIAGAPTTAGGASSQGGATNPIGNAGATANNAGGVTNVAGGGNHGGNSGGTAGSSNGGVVAGNTNGTAGAAGHPNAGTAGASVAGSAGTTSGAVCGTGYQTAQLDPVYMVFLYDKSGSMGDDPTGNWQNLSSRWAPMKLGMVDFFTNAGTPGVEASLRFFPAPGDKATTCQADYATPTVPMTPLQTPAPLIDALDTAVPGGGTPTLPAVMGGIAYAKRLMADHPGAKAVVVLVTDGEPALYNPTAGTIDINCAPLGSTLTNTIADIVSVTNAAYRGTPSVMTYVIGIGEAQDNMSAIATAGGTQFIQLDATQPPAQTRTKLTTALQNIRTTQFQCGMPIPFSAGFRPDLLSVSFKHSNGTVEGFSMSATCANAGWYVDNEVAPSQIILCPSTCASIQCDLAGTLQLQLACAN
jgi:hypothetical protein